MRIKVKHFIFVLWIVLAIPLLLALLWLVRPKSELRLLVLDKTVLTTKCQEHLSLFWVLNNGKFAWNGKRYNLEKDYLGFFPDGKGGYSVNDLDSLSSISLLKLAQVSDAAYYTDLYGIYSNEWKETYFKEGLDSSRYMSERSNLLYGGMKSNDLEFLLHMKQKGKLIVTEFNNIASPTRSDIRGRFEKEFGVAWTGWVGRYFEELDTLKNRELPSWLINNYLEQNGGNWPFTRSGIVFVRDDDRVVILENETDLIGEVPEIRSSKAVVKRYGVNATVNYPFWFDVVEANKPNHVLSFYHLQVNPRGDSILTANGLRKEFPAVVHSLEGCSFYYFAGDFCDNPLEMTSSFFDQVGLFQRFFHSSLPIDRRTFFWQFYRPFMNTVLKDYHKSLNRD